MLAFVATLTVTSELDCFAIPTQISLHALRQESITAMDQVAAMNINSLADLSDLTSSKLDLLHRSLKFILLSAIAEDTFAQIIDGQPTRPSYKGNYRSIWDPDVSERTCSTESSIREWTKIKEAFVPQTLKLDVHLIQAFQNALEHSRLEDLRLLEMVAVSLHFLAGAIYASSHPDKDISPPNNPNDHRFYMTFHFWVDFYQASFKSYLRYPFGLLNVVGYWAETQILGGVFLFQRGPSGGEVRHYINISHIRQSAANFRSS